MQDGVLVRAIVSRIDIEFLDAESHQALGDPQIAGSLGLVSRRIFQGLDNHLSLYAAHRFFEGSSHGGVRCVGGLKGGGQMMAVHYVIVGNEDGALDAVFEFAYVSGPMVTHQHINSGGRYSPDILVVLLAVLLDEEVGEFQDIGSPVTEGGDMYGEYVDAVV